MQLLLVVNLSTIIIILITGFVAKTSSLSYLFLEYIWGSTYNKNKNNLYFSKSGRKLKSNHFPLGLEVRPTH